MPYVLQAYAAFVSFVLLAWIACLVSLGFPAIGNRLAPYGVVTSLNLYLFTVYSVFALPGRTQSRRMALSLAPLVSATMFSGLFDLYRMLAGGHAVYTAHTTNPYLQYAPMRAVICIAVPLFWVLMLLSPSVWRWVRQKDLKRRVHLSLLDLFYLMLVVAVCTALSLQLVSYARGRLAVPNIRQYSTVSFGNPQPLLPTAKQP
ncbi:MAG: hypothetical protein DWQ37_01025 [Planctomycetota bacterium]|nr:MAG: hypothetical protein DWQ37_01025 [Planctomycetota bacterium]